MRTRLEILTAATRGGSVLWLWGMIMLGATISMVIVSEELAFPVRGSKTRINRRAGGEMVKLRSGGV